MDLIQMARQMGKDIQASEEYINLNVAKEANDNDQELQDLIGKFNLKRIELNTAMSKDEKDDEAVKAMDAELKEIYQQVMQNKNMMAFNDAKKAIDSMMNKITTILMMSVNGDDPETCDTEQCGGSCSSCSGCH